jgi:hypothetical protein
VTVEVTLTSSDAALAVVHLQTAAAEIQRPATDRIALSPGDTTIDPGVTHALTARLAGEDVAGQVITFSLSGPGSLSASSATTNAQGEAEVSYFASATAGQVTVTATISEDGHDFTSSNVITVDADVEVSIDPTTVILATNQQQQFTALLTGASDPSVTWSMSCAGGSISTAGLFLAPSTAATCVVTATSNEDPSASASADVTVIASGPTISWFDGSVSAQDWMSGATEADSIELFPWPASRSTWHAFETTSSSGATGTSGVGSYSVTSTGSQDVTPTFVDGYLRTLDIATSARVDTTATGCATGDTACVANGHARSELNFIFDVAQASTVQLTGTLTAFESAVTSNDRRCEVTFFNRTGTPVDYEVTCGFDGSGTFAVFFSGTLAPGRYELDVMTIATSNSYSFRSSGSASAASSLHLEVTPQ